MVGQRGGGPLGAVPAVAPPRFLFYSHDGVGLGHVRRNLCVASALAELIPEVSILVVTSTEEADLFGIPPGVDLLKLPGLRKVAKGHYVARRLPMRWEELRSMRTHLFTAAVESFRPHVLLVDKHPFGIGEELGPALEAARDAGAQAILGLRDVLDDPVVVRAEWDEHHLLERIPDYYDRILVYGQPELLDLPRVYDFPDSVRALTRFCGYVVSSGRDGGWEDGFPDLQSRRPLVLGTAGGGEDGFALLSTFMEAAAGAHWQGVVVSGPQSPPARARALKRLADEAGVIFRRFVPNISSAFSSLDALVSMGGYNTLAEAASSAIPTVCVPRVRPRREQLIRARAFAHRGLLRLVEPELLDAATLRVEIEAAIAGEAHPNGRNEVLDLGGARRAALHLRELAAAGRRAHTPGDAAAAG